ncbi:MAG TPA: chromosome segregation protein SMC [Chloroflexia bacterium]|nr:chromosome segregation protein SMC [Chloroflexia bacterium]
MYLKRLQVHGFKTFAQKTEFLYDNGVTAIVGPNGSGKSNIADAIRWVLGEQRYSVLRGRKTEDVIFAGSSLKSAMGFAEASITFDNSDGKLPLDFNEVTITRRAYRTGENEYYINKSRVRLKDVVEAITPLSQTYTVITQGMVDAALSQKPEERRGLFEDAASIGLYNMKKAEAETSLAKQEENARHVQAMISEIEPRLKVLEKHARQAEEYYTLHEELQVLLKRYYGDRWRKANAALNRAEVQEKQAREALEAAKAELEALQARISASRARQNEKRAGLAGRHQESSQLHSRAQQLQQQIAVDQERLNGFVRQRETQEQELVNLQIALEGAQTRLQELEREHAAILASQGDESTRLKEQDAIVKARSTEARQAEEALERQRQEVGKQLNRLESVRQRKTQLAERRAELSRQEEQYFQNRDGILARRGEVEEEQATSQATLAGFEEQSRLLNERRKQLEAEGNTANEVIRKSERSISEARSKLESARSRLQLLNRLQSNFTGLYGGVKSVMQSASGPQPSLKGILGLVANLLEAPAELEVAIEVALGMHLQDVVVEHFEDAETAINHLKSIGAGRATFLPLDNLRSGSSSNPRNVLNMSGVRGIASDLIKFENRYRPVYEQLLGRVLVVEDLQVGRAAMREAGGGWTAVTLNGEILRGSGAVTGGASGKEKDRAEGSVLMRERELRELPLEISRLEKQLADLAGKLSQAQANATRLRQQQSETEREVQQLNRQQQQAREKLANLRAQVDRFSNELKVREESHQGVNREISGLAEREAQLASEQGEAEKLREEAVARQAELEQALRAASEKVNEEREKLVAMRTSAALVEQRIKTSADNLMFVRNENRRIQEQIESRSNQQARLEKDCQQLQQTLAEAQAELQKLAKRLESLRATITPLEAELAELEKSQGQQEREWSEMSAALLALEAAHGRAELETQRLSGEIETLRERAANDLAPSLQLDGTVDEESAAGAVDPSEWEELLELTDREAIQLAERVEQLRNKLRRIGAVNPLAMQEYRETSQRYEFLSNQLNDLGETTRTLRSLIKELDEVTQARFAATFEKVAEEFKRFFSLLFNGGSAKLVLTNPDNLANTGIEILAQPPGKRQQSLALLSGGERALTAVALLFALLEVNPSPFCVLDEVDAALDESNVGRFCETLRTLAHKTQFIVITHNRGTIEAARTIYGVSMGPESVSKIMSLRVDEVTDFKVHGSKFQRAKSLSRDPAEPVLN